MSGHVITIVGHQASCTCGFEVDLVVDENPRGKIEEHGRENDFKVLVNDMSV